MINAKIIDHLAWVIDESSDIDEALFSGISLIGYILEDIKVHYGPEGVEEAKKIIWQKLEGY